MSILHTINGTYPDKNFNFTVDAESIGIVADGHQHESGEIGNLPWCLNGKASTNHTHVAVPKIDVEDTEITGVINLSSGVNANLTSSVANNEITISSNPGTNNPIKGIRNANPARSRYVLYFGSNLQSVTGNAEYITFKEDSNAALSQQ